MRRRDGMCGDVHAVEHDPPGVDRIDAGDEIEHRGLAGAVRSDQPGAGRRARTEKLRFSTTDKPPKRLLTFSSVRMGRVALTRACSFRLAQLRTPSSRRICAPVIEALRTQHHHHDQDRGKQHVAPVRAAAQQAPAAA